MSQLSFHKILVAKFVPPSYDGLQGEVGVFTRVCQPWASPGWETDITNATSTVRMDEQNIARRKALPPPTPALLLLLRQLGKVNSELLSQITLLG